MPLLLRVVLVSVTACFAGCRSQPVVTAPHAPGAGLGPSAVVYLAHYDYYHTGLVVPRDGRAVEYTYADWDMLALGERTGWNKFKAVALPSRGALGRAEVPWQGGSDASLRESLDRCWKLSRYRVDARRLDRLTETLDADFAAAVARTGSVAHEGMSFAKAPRPYWILHNCNHALREWLIDLGFGVPRRVALADFQTPGAVHTYAPGRESGGMRTDFSELVGERPDGD